MKLIVGLGNVGEHYAQTRHNIGFMVVDELARELNAPAFTTNKKLLADVSQVSSGDEALLLIRPTTMMNQSGQAAAAARQFYKLQPADVWVVTDDVDLPFGTVRIRPSGGAGTHQGMKSVVAALGEGFPRTRVGIGDNRIAGQASEDYVLAGFDAEQRSRLAEVIKSAADQTLAAIGQLN